MKFKKPIEVQAGISDGDPDNPLGQAGYLLSSDGSNVNWVSPGGLSAETAEAIVQPIKANEALAKGDPVYIVGYNNGQDVNIVAKADSSDVAKMPVVGLADDDYASQAFGTITAFGSFNGAFDTTGGTENWAIGDIIFVKPGGGLTNIKPGGTDLIQNIAIVSRVQQNTGELEVIALGRTNDVPNLPEGRLFVGTSNNTSLASDVIYVDDTSDRVGIGTDDPEAKLEVVGESGVIIDSGTYNQAKLTLIGSAGSYGGGGIIDVIGGASDYMSYQLNLKRNPNTLEAFNRYWQGDHKWEWDGNTGGTAAQPYTSYDFKTQGSSQMVIYNNNVGIGTTNPGSKLEVDGEIDASGSDGYRINGKPWAEESSNNLRLGDWDGEGFSTSICDDNSAVVVTVKDYGAMINCSSLTSSYGADASLAVGLGTGGAAVLTLSNTDANPSNAGDSTGIIQFAIKDDNSNLGYTSASIQGSISQAAGSGNGGGGVLDFLTAPAISGSSPQTRMRIKDSGNVGIGTTNPSSILHLEDTTPTLKILSNQYYNNSAISMGNGQSEAAFITCSNNPGISNLELRYDNGSTGDGRIRVGQRNLDFMIDAVSAMYINSSKNVGIGTTFPSEKLTVGGNISIASPNSFLVKNGDSNHGLKYGYNTFASNPTDGPILYGYDAGGLGTKRSSENIALYWNYLGNVGIGTTDPNHELVVEGASSPNIELKNTSYSNGGFVLNRANYTQQWKWWAESSQMYFGFSTDESTYSNKLLIKSNGNVGIGATNPSEKLDVVGNIKVSGDQYFNGAAIYGDNKEIIRYSDTWLRINPANNFTNGIYCGSGILRTDGIFQVGPSGSKFVVNSIGNVGINGTPSTTTSTKLKVYGTITSTGGSGFQIENGYGNPRLGDFYGSFTTTHPLYVGSPYSGLACHASAFNITSDYRLKENEALLTEASSRIKKLKPIRFNYINSENTVDGFLAHEVAEVIPEAVTGEKDAIREDGSDELQGLDLSKIVPLLTAALQESITKIEKLEQRIQTLENK